jgi:hypothetical protein
MVFVAPHSDLILMLAGMREIVGRLQANRLSLTGCHLSRYPGLSV